MSQLKCLRSIQQFSEDFIAPSPKIFIGRFIREKRLEMLANFE